MGFRSSFTTPPDTRWQGIQRGHHIWFFCKNILLAFFFIPLVIVEGVLFKKWWEAAGYGRKSDEYTPYFFWLRIGMALVPDLLVTLITTILILNPLHRATISCHPIYALISAFIMFALWLNCAWLSWLIPYSSEVSFDNRQKWENICLGELVIEALMTLCWFIMFVLACIATRKWDVQRMKGGQRDDVKMNRVSGEEGV